MIAAAAAVMLGLMPAPGPVEYRAAPCPTGGHRACAFDHAERPVVYVAPGQPLRVWRHEAGHAFDYRVLTDADRQDAAVILSEPGRSWRGGEHPINERAADAYALCSILPGDITARRWRANLHRWRTLGYQPSRRMHRRMCALFIRAANRP